MRPRLQHKAPDRQALASWCALFLFAGCMLGTCSGKIPGLLPCLPFKCVCGSERWHSTVAKTTPSKLPLKGMASNFAYRPVAAVQHGALMD